MHSHRINCLIPPSLLLLPTATNTFFIFLGGGKIPSRPSPRAWGGASAPFAPLTATPLAKTVDIFSPVCSRVLCLLNVNADTA